MARYTGPVCRLCRRAGMKLFLKGERCFTPKCAVERRPTPPGASPSDRRRRKESEFGLQLNEKQKARNIYGVLERQFRKHFTQAERTPGATGENLLRILETLTRKSVPRWLELDPVNLSGRVTEKPSRGDIEGINVNEALVVEYYSR